MGPRAVVKRFFEKRKSLGLSEIESRTSIPQRGTILTTLSRLPLAVANIMAKLTMIEEQQRFKDGGFSGSVGVTNQHSFR